MFNTYNPKLRSIGMKKAEVPRTRLRFAENDIAIRGNRYWNDTDETFTNAVSLKSLKLQLKRYENI